jgi:hypothetical protein
MSDSYEVFSLAVQLGKRLSEQATETTLGVRFPEILDKGEKKFLHDLYSGAAGAGIALLDLYNVSGDTAYSRMVQEVSYDLIESTPNKPPVHPGLYAGYAGVGLFHLYTARALNDDISLKAALRISDMLAVSPFHGTDIIAGAAGTGIFFLSLYYATQDERFLDYARSAVQYLGESAVQEDNSLCWAPLIPEWGKDSDRDIPHTGLAHGVAGICLFLIEMTYAVQDNLSRNLLQGALKWLDARMVDGANGYGWPVSATDSRLRYHWCHGTTGIAHTYLSLFRETGDRRALKIAVEAGKTSLNLLNQHRNKEDSCHCHGFSGIIELFLDLAEHDDSEDWCRIASGFQPIIVDRISEWYIASNSEAKRTGLALGTAGIVRLLLRMSGKSTLPILHPLKEALDISDSDKTGEVFFSDGGPEPIDARTCHSSENALLESSGNELLPRVAARLTDDNHIVILCPPDKAHDADFFERFTAHSKSEIFFDALKKVKKMSSEIEHKYEDIISPGVLNNQFHGTLFREIAGMCMQDLNRGRDATSIADILTEQYTAMLALLFRRLSSDLRGPLSNELKGRLKKMEILSSDPHRSGQKVIALQFDNGNEVIYKSRSVALERYLVGASRHGEKPSLAELLNKLLNPTIPVAGLPTQRVIQGGQHYGYVERIKTDLVSIKHFAQHKIKQFRNLKDYPAMRANVLKKSEENSFWYSAGLLAGYAVGLGLTDLNSENLVCGSSVSTPRRVLHPVDIELAFHEVDCLRDTALVDLTHIEEPGMYARGVHQHVGFEQELRLCGSATEAWLLEVTRNGLRLVPGTQATGAPELSHFVRNSDGSFGYGCNLCWMLKGMIDLWETMREHVSEISEYLKENLSGSSVRILAKPTKLYNLMLRKYRCGAYPVAGAAWSADYEMSHDFTEEEIRQLRSCDIPYFFRYLGEENSTLSRIRWFDSQPEGDGSVVKLENIYHVYNPFWRIVERQTELKVLARSLADAAAFAAPEGSFDIRHDELGIRVFRTDDEPNIWIVALLTYCRLTCRVEGEGGVSIWAE